MASTTTTGSNETFDENDVSVCLRLDAKKVVVILVILIVMQ